MTETARVPYDASVLDVGACLADAAWLRASGITNAPDRLETLVKAYDRLNEQREAVLALHSPDEQEMCTDCRWDDGSYVCYPCATARALGVTDD